MMFDSWLGSTLENIKQSIKQRVSETGFDYSQYKKYNVDVCDLCNGKHLILFAHQDRYCLPVRSMRCKGCGLIFITPRMDSVDYNLFYDKWYRKLVDAHSGNASSEETIKYSRQMQSDEMVKFLGQHLPVDKTIKTMLDVGGSTGVFAEKICSTLGASGVVIDPNPHELKEANDKKLTTSVTTFENYKTDKKFDLISMLRTVEHLQSISKSFEYVVSMLNDDGVFLLDIVNHNWLISHFKSSVLSTKIDHIYQLTDVTICKYLDKFGFEIIGSSDKESRYISYLAKQK